LASLKDLRNKIKSVKSIQQVTNAMKMVAAAKLRKSQEDMENISISLSDDINYLINIYYSLCQNIIYYHNKFLNYLL